MGAPLAYNATLVERVDLTDALALFRVLPDDGVDPAGFVPGQYMTLGLNNEAEPAKGSVRRPMSIASAPCESRWYEFYIRWVAHPESDNPLTHLLFRLRSGDRMHLRRAALGKFTVRDTVGQADPRLRVLVAAGTGLAPFTSMVFQDTHERPEARLDRWVVLHGASYPAELGYREALEALARDKGLVDLPTISRPKEAPTWTRSTGRVEDFFLADRLANTESAMGLGAGALTPQHACVLICGLTGTIANTVERLLPRGFIPDHKKTRAALELEGEPSIFFEQYDNEPLFDLKNPDEVARLRALAGR